VTSFNRFLLALYVPLTAKDAALFAAWCTGHTWRLANFDLGLALCNLTIDGVVLWWLWPSRKSEAA
jgi:hypothetical protein